ncbi:hypothetical protein [Actinomadura sp. 6N118]|uniref:hypothetical protein n=1 Tax=Actinomadura sp. 6N118 TaxID=3375151 RepID=UPI003798BBDD
MHGQTKITGCFGKPDNCKMYTILQDWNPGTKKWVNKSVKREGWRNCKVNRTQTAKYKCKPDVRKHYWRSWSLAVIRKNGITGTVGSKGSPTIGDYCR